MKTKIFSERLLVITDDKAGGKDVRAMSSRKMGGSATGVRKLTRETDASCLSHAGLGLVASSLFMFAPQPAVAAPASRLFDSPTCQITSALLSQWPGLVLHKYPNRDPRQSECATNVTIPVGVFCGVDCQPGYKDEDVKLRGGLSCIAAPGQAERMNTSDLPRCTRTLPCSTLGAPSILPAACLVCVSIAF